jgi:thiol-disulfide isomerase/thioredoxin
MKHPGLVLALAALPLLAQSNLSQLEEESLQTAIGEAGNSPIDFARAIENHLKRFPNSPRKAELERALIKTAIDLNDDRRIILFGESVLKREPENLQVLEHIATALLHNGDKASTERALIYGRRCQEIVEGTYKNDKFVPGGGREELKRKDDFDRGLARARLLQARAQGLLGHNEDAIQLAEASYQVFPSVEAAREAARWLSAAGKDQQALQYLADAFTISGLQSANPDAANDRTRMAELYRKLTGSQTGLGDVILKAYDETAGLLAQRRTELQRYDPNSQTKDPMEFTFSGVEGEKLKLSSLLGKVIVLDFWATWCGPCRGQHPLYEEVKARFKDSDDVVFLSLDTDEDHSLVKPFLESQKWTQKVYFDDGLQSVLQVSSIPTTIVFGKKGEVVSRMIGYLPERFVDMLSDRIAEALGRPSRGPVKGAISQ